MVVEVLELVVAAAVAALVVVIVVITLMTTATAASATTRPPRWPSGKASALRAKDPGFESRLRRDFFRVESYQ